MSEDPDTTPNLYNAHQAFAGIAQAAAFTPNELALFLVLLQSWNAARRPTVIEQWAITTCGLSGIEERKGLPKARNKLKQHGVIFFNKNGNRGVPQYSFNALFNLPNPFLGASQARKRGSKWEVNGGVSGTSYQGKGKEKEKPPTPGGEKTGDLDSPGGDSPPSKTQLEQLLVEKWNNLPPPIRKLRGKVPQSAQRAFSARAKDPEWLQDWEEALEAMKTDPHCLGQNEGGWVATIDYFLRPGTLNKLLSRKDGRKLSGGTTAPQKPKEEEPEGWKPVHNQLFGSPPSVWSLVPPERKAEIRKELDS